MLVATEIGLRSDHVELGVSHALRIPVVVNFFCMYDVSADGRRFLVAVPREQHSSSSLTLVQNWKTLLQKNR